MADEFDDFDEFEQAATPDALAPLPQGGALAARRPATLATSQLGIDPAQIASEYEAVLAAKQHDDIADDDGLAASGLDLDAALAETIVDSRTAWQGSYLTVEEVDIDLADGSSAVHEVVRHPGAVGIIALDGEGRILLVRQYRTALERITREIPAGKISPGEDAETCAIRELAEETGYEAKTIRYLMPVAVAPGYSDEIIHLYMATDLVRGEAHPDPDEFVAAEWVDLGELIDDVLDGRIEDSKTIIAAFACDAISRRL